MGITDILKQSSHLLYKSADLLQKCAEEGTENHLADIDSFIALCEKTIESATNSENYGLAIACERQLQYWHYMKSHITGENKYQVSAFLIEGV